MKCDAEFFGLKQMPIFDLNKEVLEELARKSSSMGLTVPGVQKKLSLHLSDEGSTRLTLVGYPSGYILKPQTEDFSQLPEAEDLIMDIADLMGVRTVPHGLVCIDEEFAFITERVDRIAGDMYAMEDFCQIGGRLTEDKYKGSYERCAGIIKKYSTRIGFDLSEFFLRLLICFITGNSDMHLKNFSLIEQNPGRRDFILAPAYDLLPVNIVMPEDAEEMALTLNGKKSKLKRKDFLSLAENMSLAVKAAEKLIESVLRKEEKAKEMCRESYLSKEMRDALADLISERCRILSEA